MIGQYFDPSVKLGRYFWFVGYINVVSKSFIGCRLSLTSVERIFLGL